MHRAEGRLLKTLRRLCSLIRSVELKRLNLRPSGWVKEGNKANLQKQQRQRLSIRPGITPHVQGRSADPRSYNPTYFWPLPQFCKIKGEQNAPRQHIDGKELTCFLFSE